MPQLFHVTRTNCTFPQGNIKIVGGKLTIAKIAKLLICKVNVGGKKELVLQNFYVLERI